MIAPPADHPDELLHRLARAVRHWASGLTNEPDDYDRMRAQDLLGDLDREGLVVGPKLDGELNDWEPDL